MLIKCKYCYGLGTDNRNDRKKSCPVCLGVGQIEVPDNHVKCAFCSGSGAESFSKGIFPFNDKSWSEPCHVCKGTGVVRPQSYK